jgi:hypothetical protein
MPPWHADRRYRRYLYDPSLTDAQIRTIVRWSATGARRGDPSKPGATLPSVAPHMSRVDTRLAMPSAYTPRRPVGGGDDYRCFVLPWNADRARFVTGFNVNPGQRREVHHMILFLASPADASTVDRWETADRRAGYSCYGGPSLTGSRQIAAQFLAGWVPGSFGTDFPAGTGIRILPGSRLVLQVHYNLESTRPRPDRSVVELKLDDQVAKRAIYVPLVNFTWLIDPQTFRIPAGRKRVTHGFAADPRPIVRLFDPQLDVSRGLVAYSALLHMHRLGRSGQIAVQRPGSREILLAINRWDFDWQREYFFAEPEVIAPGDDWLSIRCVHDNSRAAQPVVNGKRRAPRTVTWGENSSDEMCIGFMYVTER